LNKGGTSFGVLSNYGRIQGGTSSDFFITTTTTNNLLLGTNNAERTRIDSSGNLLVSATTTTGFQSSTSITGSIIYAGGGFASNSTNDTAGVFNRQSTDGNILLLKKAGASVGTIGTQGGDLNIGTGACGIAFVDGVPAIYPWTTTGNTTSDAAIDLGDSAGRFKDLYLSGNIYLGGTGAANALDDYEEGTFTPAPSSGAIANKTGRYIKVGNLVHVTMKLSDFSGGTSGSVMQVGGIPFTNNAHESVGSNYISNVNTGDSAGHVSTYVYPSNTIFRLYDQGDDVGANALTYAAFDSDSAVTVSFTYEIA
jgi:hypothetical protein